MFGTYAQKISRMFIVHLGRNQETPTHRMVILEYSVTTVEITKVNKGFYYYVNLLNIILKLTLSVQ